MRAAILLSLAILNGCAAAPSLQYQEYKSYVAENLPRAKSGELKWSEYFNAVYSKASAANAPGDTLRQMNEAIRMAQRYEAGTITKEEFDYQRRAGHAEALVAAEQAAAQSTAQKSAESTAMLAAGLQMMQASGPYTIPVMAPQQPVMTQASPILGFLQGNSVSGALRYCRYSNGVVSTVAVTQFCPNSTK